MSKKLSKIIFLIMMVIMLIIPNNSIATSKVKLGDINGDNKIDSRDMLIVLRHISAKTSNKHEEWKLTGDKLKIADVTQDGEVNARDMIAMTRYIAAENSEKIKKEHPKWGEIKEIEIEEETIQEQKQDKKTEQKEEKKDDEKQEDKKQEEVKQEEIKKEEKDKTKNNETDKNDEEKTKEEPKQEENKETKQEEITEKGKNIIEQKQEETKQEEKKEEVKEPEIIKPQIIEATEINLSKTNVNINIEEAKIIEAKISPDNTTNKKVTYSSGDTSIATVEEITGKGTYYIKTKVNDKVLSVEEGKETNSAKIQIKDNKQEESQKYDFIEAGNGYYIIRARHSGKILDVQGAKKENSTQVIQYDLTGNDNQLWKLEDAGDGYYYIKSKHSGLYLDVQGGKANEGDKIIVYAGNKKDNQKFKLEKTGDVTNYAEMGMAIIKAKKIGTAAIVTKTNNGKTATCDITVKMPVSSIKLDNKISLDLTKNKSKTLTAKVLPDTAIDKSLEWSTSDKNIATVDSKGKVTAKREGTAVITAKSISNNSVTAKCTVTITKFEAQYIEHMREKAIYYDYQGACHTNYTCIIDAELCRVTIFKKINGKWDLAKANINGKTEYCDWYSFQGVNNSSRNNEGLNWFGPRSRSYKTATRIVERHENCPYGAGNKWIVEYVGPNPKYGLIDVSGKHSYQRFEYAPARGDPANVPLNKRFLSQGCCVLGNKEAYWIYKNVPDDSTVVIFDKYNPLPKWYVWDVGQKGVVAYTPSKDVPNSISVSPNNKEIKAGQTAKLTVTIDPKNASHRGITYSSSNTNVATVDKNGKITAKKAGTATITVKVLGLTATCKVTVK